MPLGSGFGPSAPPFIAPNAPGVANVRTYDSRSIVTPGARPPEYGDRASIMGSQPTTLYALTLWLGALYYYRLNEASGTTAVDSCGNSNGTYQGSTYTLNQTPLVPNTDSASVLFSGGTTASVTTGIPTSASIWLGPQFSVSLWASFTSTPSGSGRLVASGQPDYGTTSNGYEIYYSYGSMLSSFRVSGSQQTGSSIGPTIPRRRLPGS